MEKYLTRAEKVKAFREGIVAGIPIGLGYFAVSFSLGIAARGAGLSPVQGFIASILCLASAGEYVGFTLIAASASYIEVAIATFIANARYLLMSTSLSQRLHPDMPYRHRFFLAYGITDELFGIAVSREGYLNPYYSYGAFLPSMPLWAIGTALGIIAGNALPVGVVSALSVALFGMFIAIIIPPAKKDLIRLGLIVVSFAL
ncbi:MAG: AzlC family ABC transporter permease, partial [Lachnospiraceae bacterium]|nr:AzlC family ABC transporter permease [Lachnospiraceae bacterium]